MRKSNPLDSQYWAETVLCHPELQKNCPWRKLSSSAWHTILLEKPELIQYAPQPIPPSFLSIQQWLEVLIRHPELGVHFTPSKALLDKDSATIGKLWSTLLARHPEFAKYNPWTHLRSDDWEKLLSQQPQFIRHYKYGRPTEQMTPQMQACVIARQPSLFHRFKTADFHGPAWETILSCHPEFHTDANLNNLDGESLGRLLKRNPEWINDCNIDALPPKVILAIAENFPKILKHYHGFFGAIGDDNPWIEKYPHLVDDSHWHFSLGYRHVLLRRLSFWLETGKRLPVKTFADYSDWDIHPTIRLPRLFGQRRRASHPRRLALRKSLESIFSFSSIMETFQDPRKPDSLPDFSSSLRDILKDELTFHQLMIKMSMLSEEDKGLLFLGLYITTRDHNVATISDNMLETENIDMTMEVVPTRFLLPFALLFSFPSDLNLLLGRLQIQNPHAIADFTDCDGNNALHYFFFHSPWKADHDQKEILQTLLDCGVAPDQPNRMGYSYNRIKDALRAYLKRTRMYHPLNRRQG